MKQITKDTVLKQGDKINLLTDLSKVDKGKYPLSTYPLSWFAISSVTGMITNFVVEIISDNIGYYMVKTFTGKTIKLKKKLLKYEADNK